MGSTPMPYQPWFHYQNRSSSALADRGIEVGLPPRPLPYRSSSNEDYRTKALPAIPIGFQEKHNRRYSSQSASNNNDYQQPISTSVSYSANLEGTSPSRPLLGSKTYSMPASNPPPPLISPMNRPSQKVSQLIGYDHSLDKSLPLPHQHSGDSPTSSKSSGSAYSQSGMDHALLRVTENRTTEPFRPRLEHHRTYHLQTSARGHSDEGESSGAAEGKSRNNTTGQRNSKFLVRTNKDNITALGEILPQERQRYDHGFEDVAASKYKHNMLDSKIVPRPLAIRNKMRPQPIAVEVPEKPSFFASTWESFSLGVDELTSPNKTKHLNKPVADSLNEPSRTTHMPPPQSKRKRFETEASLSEPSEMKFSKRLSGAMRHFSPTSRSHTKKTVLSNAARVPEGPDTPMPAKSGFMTFLPMETFHRGNELIHDAATKARMKVNIKSTTEKRRESLKKKIMVVGITDQSPDGRVSEWL